MVPERETVVTKHGRGTGVRSDVRSDCRWTTAVAAAAAVLVLGGCSSIPMDSADSLDEIRGGELRLGAAQHPPFVEAVDPEQPKGSEVDLIEQYAQHHDATIRWETGSETVLVGMLADGKLDVVVGGFDDKTAWSKEVAPTRAYATEADGTKRVMLTQPGENALLVDLEIFLMEQAGERR